MSESFLQSVLEKIQIVGKKGNFPAEIIENFIQPNRVIEIKIPVNMDSGKEKTFIGYRSQHNNALGPYKGGIRFHPNVTREEVVSLSMLMSLKCSLVGIPYGGSKGGIIVDPKKLSLRELEELSRGYVKGLFQFIGPDIDIPAPDINTNPQIMAWMVDEYSKLKGEFCPGVFTGKPENLWGLKGRNEATGYGGSVILKKLSQTFDLNPHKTTVAIQGFGNVGYYFSDFIFKNGYKIIAISEEEGGIFSEKGINPETILNYKKQKNTIKGSAGKNITNKSLLELDVDVLVPAAIENVITEENARRIKAKYIIAMANGPITEDAQKILQKKGKIIIPDILANSGGVVASYFEWLQAKQGELWTKEKTFNQLTAILSSAFDEVYLYSRSLKIPFDDTGFYLAIKRIVNAMKLI